MNLGKFFLKSNAKKWAVKQKIKPSQLSQTIPGSTFLAASHPPYKISRIGESFPKTAPALVLSGHILSAGILECKLVIYCVCVCICVLCTYLDVCVYLCVYVCIVYVLCICLSINLQFNKYCTQCHHWDWLHSHSPPCFSYISKGPSEVEKTKDTWGERDRIVFAPPKECISGIYPAFPWLSLGSAQQLHKPELMAGCPETCFPGFSDTVEVVWLTENPSSWRRRECGSWTNIWHLEPQR